MNKKDAMDLETYLQYLPHYKWGDGMPECQHSCDTSILLNATVYADYAYDWLHQGDISIDTLRGIRKRMGNHVVFIFWECNRHHLTFDRPYQAKATTEEEKAAFRRADIILVGDRAIINTQAVLRKQLKKAGFKAITEHYEWEELTEDFYVKTKPTENAEPAKDGLTGVGALFG
jgi:hypothetical protein